MVLTNPYSIHHPYKRQRTATAVLAGEFEGRGTRDALTSLLNGASYYHLVEPDAEKNDKREQREVRKMALKAAQATREKKLVTAALRNAPVAREPSPIQAPRPLSPATAVVGGGGFWGRPSINLTMQQRAESLTPPPMPSSPPTTPGPSISSSTSRTSSKRPRTPDDDEDIDDMYAYRRAGGHRASQNAYTSRDKPKEARQRVKTKKGWKGWQEIEEGTLPTDKLISTVVVIADRKTRSGKTLG